MGQNYEVDESGKLTVNELEVDALEGVAHMTAGLMSASLVSLTADVSGVLPLTNGGSGSDLSLTGGPSQFVRQDMAGGALTVGAITDADVPNTITLDNITQITNRAISDTSGTLAVSRGGTGQTSQQQALNALTIPAGNTGRFLSSDGSNALWVDAALSFPIQSPDGSVLSPAYSFSGDTDLGLYRVGSNQLGLSSDGQLRASLSPSLFDVLVPMAVSGKASVTSLQVTGGSGTAGQLLVSDVAGNASWATVDSGHDIQDEGATQTKRTILNFVGNGVTVSDDIINEKTVVNIPGPGTDVWAKHVVTYNNFSASKSYTLFSAPAGTIIYGVKIKHNIAFPTVGTVISIGTVSDVDKYASPFDVSTAVSGTNFQLTQVFDSEDHGAAWDVVATLSHLAPASGSCEIWVRMVTVAP